MLFNTLVEEHAAYIARDLVHLLQHNQVEQVVIVTALSLHTRDSSLFYFPLVGTPNSKLAEGCKLMDSNVEAGSQLLGFLVELLRVGEMPTTIITTQMEAFPRPASLEVAHRLAKHLAVVLPVPFVFHADAAAALVPIKGALPSLTTDTSLLYI